MDLMRPGDKLSRGISTANFVMLSLDGARELRDMIDRAIAEREAGANKLAAEAFAAQHGHAPAVTAAQFAIDNLNVVIYDDGTDPSMVAEAIARRTIADALAIMDSIKQDTAQLHKRAAQN